MRGRGYMTTYNQEVFGSFQGMRMKMKMGMQGNVNRNEYCIDIVWLTQYNQ